MATFALTVVVMNMLVSVMVSLMMTLDVMVMATLVVTMNILVFVTSSNLDIPISIMSLMMMVAIMMYGFGENIL